VPQVLGGDRGTTEVGVMPGAKQLPTQSEARQFVLTTVWQGLSELADGINMGSNRIATLTVDPGADLGNVSLCVYPVGSKPAQATPLFRYDVEGSVVGSGVSVLFVAAPAVVNGELRSTDRGELAILGTAPGERNAMTPHHVRDDVARRYEAALEGLKARGQR
jgi:hypothetical protein